MVVGDCEGERTKLFHVPCSKAEHRVNDVDAIVEIDSECQGAHKRAIVKRVAGWTCNDGEKSFCIAVMKYRLAIECT